MIHVCFSHTKRSKTLKSKTLLMACVLSASAFSFNAFSQDSKFCADPIKTICTDTKDQRNEREIYINKLKSEISNEAHKNAAPKIVEMEQQNRGMQHLKTRNFVKRKQKVKTNVTCRLQTRTRES